MSGLPPYQPAERQRLAEDIATARLRRTLQTTGSVGVLADPAQRDRALEMLRMSQPSLLRLADAVLPEFAALCQLRVLPVGTLLQRAGDVGKAAWLVTDGALQERTPGPQHHEVIAVRRNQTAGLSQLMHQSKAVLEVIAVQPSEVLEVDTDRLAQLRCAYHPLAVAITEAFMPEAVMGLHLMQSRLSQLAALRGRPVPLQAVVAADPTYQPRR
jgi:CRP-like cAMP-binding protein